MKNKGFTLIEMLGCLVILGVILTIALYSTRGTLATTFSTLTDVSENEIYNAAKTYILEYNVTWINDENEYTCLTVNELIDSGYFDDDEVTMYKNSKIRIVRDTKTKVISSVKMIDDCN